MEKLSKANKVIFAITVTIMISIIVAGTVLAITFSSNKNTNSEEEKTYTKTVVHNGELQMDFSGDGTTQISTTSQLFGMDYGNGNITVTKVNVSSGNSVKKGDTLLEVSKSDVKSAVSYYKSAVEDAQKNLEKVKLQYEVGILEAGYTKELSTSTANLSGTVLSQSLAELQDAQDEAMNTYNDAKTEITTLTKNISNNTYYKTYKVAQLKKAYTEAEKKSKDAKKAYNAAKKKQSKLDSYNKNVKSYETKLNNSIDNYNDTLKEMYELLGLSTKDFVGVSHVTSVSSITESTSATTTTNNSSNGNTSGEQPKLKSSLSSTDTAKLSTLVTKLNSLETERKNYKSKMDDYQKKADAIQLEINTTKQSYDQAKQNVTQTKNSYTQGNDNYKKALEEAKTKLSETKSNLPNLLVTYEQATRDKVTKAVSLNTEYSQSKLSGSSAQSVYESTVEGLKNTLKQAKTKLSTLKAEQKIINGIKDGKVKASKAGTVASIGYSVDDTISNSTEIATYYNTKTISISVEVDQNNIGNIKVGDSATVTVSNSRQGELTGKVSTIATEATSSGSSSTVTYSVTVEVDNSNGMLSSGSSATVKFAGEKRSNVTYVSSDAVKTVNNKTVVYMYDSNNNVKKVSVSTGESTDEYTEITSGVNAGDICLIESKNEETGGSK